MNILQSCVEAFLRSGSFSFFYLFKKKKDIAKKMSG